MRSEALTSFDVHVHPRSDGGVDLHARIGNEGGQDSGGVTKDVLESLRTIRDQLDGIGHHPFDPPQYDVAWCEAKGTNVFNALLAGPVELMYRRCLKQARRDGRTLAIRVMYDAVLEPRHATIHDAPWELVFDPEERQFLALWPETCLSRYLRMPQAERPVLRSPRAPLLLSVAKSASNPLTLEDEHERIRAVTGRNMAVVPIHATGARQLRHALSNASRKGQPYRAWHHVGHGDINRTTGEFALVFEDGGEPEAVSLAEVVKVVAESGVQCAVLNICHSGTAQGLATALASANVPIVIGHRTAVYDSACISFATTLWRELSVGQPAELAMRTARTSILARALGSHWALPMLFVRVADTRLVDERD